jgi:hypothetical protein
MVYFPEPKESLALFDTVKPIPLMTPKLQDLILHVSTDIFFPVLVRSSALRVGRLKCFPLRVPSDGSIRMCVSECVLQ